MNQSLITALLAMLLFGIVFAYAVRHIRTRNPNHGQTAWLVVVGVGVVIVAFGIVEGAEAALVLGGLFAAAGAPMVVEYVDAHTTTLWRQQIADNLTSEDD